MIKIIIFILILIFIIKNIYFTENLINFVDNLQSPKKDNVQLPILTFFSTDDCPILYKLYKDMRISKKDIDEVKNKKKY